MPKKTFKQINLTPNISDHDLETKIRKIKELLTKKKEVQVRLKFTGRENHHKELGREKLDRVTLQCGDVGFRTKPPVENGSFLLMTMMPK